VVLLRQGSKRPGDRPVIRIVGHPENFERILAPHGRDCGVTRDLGSAFRGAVFGTSDKNAFFLIRECESASRDQLVHLNP
jgi:hypothetical protein